MSEEKKPEVTEPVDENETAGEEEHTTSANVAPTAEQEFVLVKDIVSGETIELPTQIEDNTLGLTTLVHAFPGAHGLKYKTDSGVTRALLIDPTGSKFIAPKGGWQDKCFSVIYSTPSITPTTNAQLRTEPSWRSSSDQNAKRKKMMDEDNSSDSDHSANGGHHQVTAKQKRTDEPPKEEKKQNQQDDDECRPTDLIVLGLPYKLSSIDLRNYFSTYGKLAMCEIKKDGKGESRGFGFIQFEDFESQLRVLARPAHIIGGRRCEVKLPLSKHGDADTETGIQKAKLFIGRLQEKVGEDTLREFFSVEAKKIDPKASIIDVFVPKPFRSFAFITFNNMKVVRELIKKGDYLVDGNSLSVSAAAPKAENVSLKMDRRMIAPSPGSDYNRVRDWRRPNYQPPTDRYSETAFLRPEQRKRAFMETSYASSPLPSEPSYHALPMTAGSSQQTLASGFETLNLNQMPSHEMINAYSYVRGMPNNPMMRHPQPYQYGNQKNSRYDYGPPGFNRGYPNHQMHPYNRDDFGYF